MTEFNLRKGLDLPVVGAPAQQIHDGPDITEVGLLGVDYIGLKPRIIVTAGDTVRRGQTLMFHKDQPNVAMVAPVSGVLRAINRGPRRALESIVIQMDDAEDAGIDFRAVGGENNAASLAEKLCAAGLWTSFRTRPYSKVPDPKSRPAAIFVTAIDTEPLAPRADIVINESAAAFERGIVAITALTDGNIYLCHEAGRSPAGDFPEKVLPAGFSGPHPAGLPGTHINFLEPLGIGKTVWTIWYQDVIAIGRLLISGHYDASRTISVCGPACRSPRLVRTVQGASVLDLTKADCPDDRDVRLLSGSILSGRAASGTFGYLGRYARQVTIIEEDRGQTLLGWIRPMADRFAVQPVLGSALSKKLHALTTNLNGGRRAMVPVGTFEQLMPHDYLPTQLLRALLIKDTDVAQALGALELDEEDLGLVTFACPAKYEYMIALRDCLEKIEKEG